MSTHDEIKDKCRAIIKKYLEDIQDAMDEVYDVLRSANYVDLENDDDWEKADQFYGFLIKEIVREWKGCDTDPFI